MPIEFRIVLFIANKQEFINDTPLTEYKKSFIKFYIKDFMTCCIMESSATTVTLLSRRLNVRVLTLVNPFFTKIT